jgi:hypothetical protein
MKKLIPFLIIVFTLCSSVVAWAGGEKPDLVYGTLYGLNIWEEDQILKKDLHVEGMSYLEGGATVGGDRSRMTFTSTAEYIESVDTGYISVPNGFEIGGENKLHVATSSEQFLVDYSGERVLLLESVTNSVTIYLAESSAGRILTLKCTDITGAGCTVSPNATLIDGSSEQFELLLNESRTYVGDGSDWWTISQYGYLDFTRKIDHTATEAQRTLKTRDYKMFCDTDGGAITILLPAGINGTNYYIYNTGILDVSVTPNGADLIDGINADKVFSKGVIALTYEDTEGWW